MKVIGLAGWSGAGRTTLLERLIPVLAGRGLRVSAVEHARDGFEVDRPGKDSWRQREAGLAALLPRMARCDLILLEGYKREPHPKIEVFRAANGKPPLHRGDAAIVGVASDTLFPEARVPVLTLDDIGGIADLAMTCGAPLGAVLARLEEHGPAQ
jgi:molybdopterin-guanine dinucleotide biosynthesis protein B